MPTKTRQYRCVRPPAAQIFIAFALSVPLLASPVMAQTAVAQPPARVPAARLAAPWRISPMDRARQQQPPPSPTGRGSWQVEFSVGAFVATLLGDGVPGQLPPPGASFNTSSGRPSRRVSTWYFGDGALLLNDTLAATPGVSSSTRLAPLDSVLVTTGLAGRVALTGGFKIVKAVTPRFSVEAGLDVGQSPYALSQQTLDQIEISRASFAPAFLALFSDPTRFTSLTATSTAGLEMGGGYRVSLTGAVRISLPDGHGISPYLVAGGGGVFNFGDGPGFALTGNYTFMSPGFGTRVWDETDQFMVRYKLAPVRPLGVFGAGFKHEFSRGRGIIVDGRVHVAPDGFQTMLESRPGRVTGANAVTSTPTTPSIQFSSFGAISSSLQTNLSGFSSHHGSMTINTALMVGYYIRY